MVSLVIVKPLLRHRPCRSFPQIPYSIFIHWFHGVVPNHCRLTIRTLSYFQNLLILLKAPGKLNCFSVFERWFLSIGLRDWELRFTEGINKRDIALSLSAAPGGYAWYFLSMQWTQLQWHCICCILRPQRCLHWWLVLMYSVLPDHARGQARNPVPGSAIIGWQSIYENGAFAK